MSRGFYRNSKYELDTRALANGREITNVVVDGVVECGVFYDTVRKVWVARTWTDELGTYPTKDLADTAYLLYAEMNDEFE